MLTEDFINSEFGIWGEKLYKKGKIDYNHFMKKIFNIITENIKDNNVFFVFPTEIAADLWLEKYIVEVYKNNLDFPKAVALERFLSWDKFKTSSIKSTRQDRDIIPSIVRKIFTVDLISKNKELIKIGKEPIFTEIIRKDYVDSSLSFAGWITKILPQLAIWKKKYFANKTKEEALPIEKDYFSLCEEYEKFLDENNLYDSAWETPPFADEGKTYIIFYPESLRDFEEYRELLISSSHIKLYGIKDLLDDEKISKGENPKAMFFENSAQELHHLMLFLKKSHENDGVPYENMAISLTDPENFLPYLERELQNYRIPFTTRIGKPMGKYLSGRLFSSIQDCYKNHFSFDSFQNLLTNESLFWKNPEMNQLLLNFGIKNNCFCAYEDEKGILKSPFYLALKEAENYRGLFNYYKALEKIIVSMCESSSFTELISNYWNFRTVFLKESEEDPELISEAQAETDAILGRIVEELSNLLSLEKDKNLFNLKIPSYFDFFVDYISDKEYLSKPKNRGVNIYAYKVAAAAPFDLHIIPNATQSKLSVVFPKLSFLPKDLKEDLKILDRDISDIFLKMYLNNSEKSSFFSASTYSYSGYSIIHNLLKEETALTVNPYGIYDVVAKEKEFWLKPEFSEADSNSLLKKITTLQKEGFEAWHKHSSMKVSSSNIFDPISQELIDSFFIRDGRFEISSTILSSYYQCPRKMLLEKVQKIFQESENAKLSSLDTGKILHGVLELYFGEYKKIGKTIEKFSTLENGNLMIENLLQKVIEDYKSNPINLKILESQKSEIKNKIIRFLEYFTELYEDFSVCGTELELSSTILSKEESGLAVDINLMGKIDLVISKDDSVFIVDYKTQKTPTIKECKVGENEDPKNFQLAFYTYLFEASYNNVEVDGASFVSIEKCKEFTIFTSQSKNNRKVFQETIDKTQKLAISFAKRLINKNLGLENLQIKEKCSECVYKKICRGLYSVSGRNIYTGEEK